MLDIYKRVIVNCSPPLTVGRQITDRLPTGYSAFLDSELILSKVCFSFLLRNAPNESYKSEDDYKETDSLLDDEGAGTDEPARNASSQSKKKKKPSLTKTLWSLFGINFAMAVICKLLHDMLIFIQPQLLK